MQELGLIGLRIQRMPSEPDLEFGIPSQYSYMTVSSKSYFSFFLWVICNNFTATVNETRSDGEKFTSIKILVAPYGIRLTFCVIHASIVIC